MFTFDGQAKAQRKKISLSGAKEKTLAMTKDELIERTKRERESRLRERVLVSKSVVVQKHYRSVMRLRRSKRSMRLEDRDDGDDGDEQGTSEEEKNDRRFRFLHRFTYYANASDVAKMTDVLEGVVSVWISGEERLGKGCDDDEDVGRDDGDIVTKRRRIAKALRWCLRRLSSGDGERIDGNSRNSSNSRNIDDHYLIESGHGIVSNNNRAAAEEEEAVLLLQKKRTLAKVLSEYLLNYGEYSDLLIREVAKDEGRNIKGAIKFTDVMRDLVRNTTTSVFEDRVLFKLVCEIGRVAFVMDSMKNSSSSKNEGNDDDEYDDDAMDVGEESNNKKKSNKTMIRSWGESFATQILTAPLIFRKLIPQRASSEYVFLTSADAKAFAPTATLFLRALSKASNNINRLLGKESEEGYASVAWALGNICEWSRTPEFGVGYREMNNNDDKNRRRRKGEVEVENAMLFANACALLVDALPLSALPDEDEHHYSSSFQNKDSNMSFNDSDEDNDDEDEHRLSRVKNKSALTTTTTVTTMMTASKKNGAVFDTVQVPPLLKRQLASLWNPPSSMLSSQLATACAADEYSLNANSEESEKNSAKVAKFILGISSVLRCKDRLYFLASFAFQCADVMQNLWRSVSSQYAKDPKQTIRDSKWREQLGALSEIYAVHAQTADDDEFYKTGKPLTIEESKFLVEIAKTTLWFQLWEDPYTGGSRGMKGDLSTISNSKNDNAASVSSHWRTERQIEATASVLQNLHDRNGRRQFAPPELFYAAELCGGLDSGFMTPAVDSFLREYSEGGKKSRASNVLSKCSCLAPFEVRVRAFGAATQKFRDHENGMSTFTNNSHRNSEASWIIDEIARNHAKKQITVERGKVLQQGFKQLFLDYADTNPQLGMRKCIDSLQGNVRVKFYNEHGAEEAGVDGGGLFKDFLSATVEEAFDPKDGNFLFCETPDRTLYPNPRYGKTAQQDQRNQADDVNSDDFMITYDSSERDGGQTDREKWLMYSYFYLGAILGKACGEGILLDAPLAGFFLSKLKSKPPELADLTTFDPEVYKNLIILKGFEERDFDDLELYFVALDRSNPNPDVPRYIDLIPNGSNIRVNKKKCPSYLHAMANYLLDGQIRVQSAAFVEGFRAMVRPSTLKLFTPAELGLLISGSGGGVDVDDLARSTNYMGGYDADHPVVQRLWRVTRNMSKENQRKLLKFVTSSANTPLLGFGALVPSFCVHRAASGSEAHSKADLTRLPSAATCMNLLKLPPYETDEEMEKKLIYAISNAKAFDLS